jgi:hypothetical protein
MAVLQENHSKISPPIKAAIAEFFSTAFLDRFPLRRVSKLDVNCFEFEDIEKLNLMDLPIRWINGDVSIKKLKAKDKVDIQKVTTIMSNLFVETFKKLP